MGAHGGLMGMLGMTGEDMQMMMQMMEMKAHCKCTSSDVAYGEMAMPTVPMAAGKVTTRMTNWITGGVTNFYQYLWGTRLVRHCLARNNSPYVMCSYLSNIY